MGNVPTNQCPEYEQRIAALGKRIDSMTVSGLNVPLVAAAEKSRAELILEYVVYRISGAGAIFKPIDPLKILEMFP